MELKYDCFFCYLDCKCYGTKSEKVKQNIKQTCRQVKDVSVRKVGLLTDNCLGDIRNFSRRFHNAGNALIGNECHPRKSKGKIK